MNNDNVGKLECKLQNESVENELWLPKIGGNEWKSRCGRRKWLIINKWDVRYLFWLFEFYLSFF